MHPPLSRVEPFVHTAEKLSFRAAAKQLGVTPTAVSKAISALEAELGVKLLHRTSRRVALTPEGAVYLRHCREALDRLQAGRDLVMHQADVAQGLLKASASVVLGRPLMRALPRLLSRFPGLQVHLSCSDVAVNLVDEEVDVALRIGPLADSSLVARRLRTPRWVTVAAPAVLTRRGTPQTIADLGHHTCLQFALPSGQKAAWRFASGDFQAREPLLVDHGDLLVEGVLAGLGVAQVFDFMVAEHLREGSLVEVLPEEGVAGPPVHALVLPGRQGIPGVRALLDFAVETFGVR